MTCRGSVSISVTVDRKSRISPSPRRARYSRGPVPPEALMRSTSAATRSRSSGMTRSMTDEVFGSISFGDRPKIRKRLSDQTSSSVAILHSQLPISPSSSADSCSPFARSSRSLARLGRSLALIITPRVRVTVSPCRSWAQPPSSIMAMPHPRKGCGFLRMRSRRQVPSLRRCLPGSFQFPSRSL
jgi:hypothetical protein